MRKFLFLLLFYLTCLVILLNQATAQNTASTNTSASVKLSQEEKEERNKKIALANVEAIRGQSIDAASKDFAPDIVNYGNGQIPPQRGAAAVTASLRLFAAAFPIDKIENLSAVADGDMVMIWGKWTGSWRGDFMGQKATGKTFTKTDVEILRFSDGGKITEHHSVQSMNEIARQIGLKLPGQ